MLLFKIILQFKLFDLLCERIGMWRNNKVSHVIGGIIRATINKINAGALWVRAIETLHDETSAICKDKAIPINLRLSLEGYGALVAFWIGTPAQWKF
jgi:hypothetical protein